MTTRLHPIDAAARAGYDVRAITLHVQPRGLYTQPAAGRRLEAHLAESLTDVPYTAVFLPYGEAREAAFLEWAISDDVHNGALSVMARTGEWDAQAAYATAMAEVHASGRGVIILKPVVFDA